jgi:uncharacterized protein YfiM (DUF2279 family)
MHINIVRITSFFLLLLFLSLSVSSNGQECGISVAFHPSKEDTTNVSDKWIAWDKLEHLGISAFFSATLYNVLHDFYYNDRKSSLYLSSGLTFSLGLGKEFYDRDIRKTKFSFKDLTADILGIGLGLWIATR